MKARIANGDRVSTPQGDGVVRGMEEHNTWPGGKPEKTIWLMVELDSARGQLRYVLPVTAEKLEAQ